MRKSCLTTLCKITGVKLPFLLPLLFSIIYLALFFFLVHLNTRLPKYAFAYCPSFPIKMKAPWQPRLPIVFTATLPVHYEVSGTPKVIKCLLNKINKRKMMGVWRELKKKWHNFHDITPYPWAIQDICHMPDMRYKYQ